MRGKGEVSVSGGTYQDFEHVLCQCFGHFLPSDCGDKGSGCQASSRVFGVGFNEPHRWPRS
jgi:hypothetical protein